MFNGRLGAEAWHSRPKLPHGEIPSGPCQGAMGVQWPGSASPAISGSGAPVLHRTTWNGQPQARPVHNLPTQSAQMQSQVCSQMPDDYANKVAEVTVLRSRNQQLERDTIKLQNDLAQSKDAGAQNEKMKQMKANVDRLENELRYVGQDLMTSEESRRRLQNNVQELESELTQVKATQAARPPAPSPNPLGTSVGVAACSSAGSSPPVIPAVALSGLATPSPAVVASPPLASPCGRSLNAQGPTSEKDPSQWRHEVLVHELASWESAAKVVMRTSGASERAEWDWYRLRQALAQADRERGTKQSHCGVRASSREVVGEQSTALAVASAITEKLCFATEARHWTVMQGGARFSQVWIGMFAEVVDLVPGDPKVDSLASVKTTSLFNALAVAFHVAVLDSRDAPETLGERQECAAQLVETLREIAAKLRPSELDVLAPWLRRPSFCALIATTPGSGSLHVPCLSVVLALLANPTLFTLAHRTDSHENILLAAANLLVVPCIARVKDTTGSERESDSLQRLECRVATLEFFCRCLATSPRLDVVLQLRGAPTIDDEPVDTVLQRVVFLCHHELLCLKLHGVNGGPCGDTTLRKMSEMRLRCAELALMVLSSFIWHEIPWSQDSNDAQYRTACAEKCNALGRTRPLLPSIVDLVLYCASKTTRRRASSLLSSASALRVVLAYVDGDDGGGESVADSSVHLDAPMVID